jgi:hypothetical protein
MTKPTTTPHYITLNAIIDKNRLTFSYLPPAAKQAETLSVTVSNPLNIEKKIEQEANALGKQYHQIILIERKSA